MKKNKMMRVASILLVAVLLSTSIISGTFAKYVTSGETGDSARVAKFGVVVTAEGSLFSENYKRVNDGNNPGTAEADHSLTTPNANGFSMTVESSNGDKVVAPGTENKDGGLKLGVTGTPEVDVRVKFDISNVKDVFLKQNAALPDMTTANKTDTFDSEADYYPIVYTLKGDIIAAKKTVIEAATTGATIDETAKTAVGTLAQIKAVLEAINGADGIYVDANTNLSNVANGGIGSLTLTWEWRFEEDPAVVNATAKATAEAYWETQNTLKGQTAGDNGAEPTQAAIDAATAFIQANGDKDTYATTEGKAAAKALRDKKDTLLGDLAAQKLGDSTFTGFTPALPADYDEAHSSYSLDAGISITISVTQVD